MNVQNIIDRARTLGYVDSNQYSNTIALQDFNVIYHELENTIVTEVSEDFFWDIITVTTTIANQSEYGLPEGLGNGYTSLYKNLGLSIKYDTEYKKAKKTYPYLLEQDLSHYKTNQPQSKPIYHMSDKSFFIYPAPLTSVANGIKIYGIKNLADLLITSTEGEVFNGSIPSKFHHIISLGMLEFIYQGRGMINEANNARARYERERSKLVEYLSDRDDGILEMEQPDLSYYA